jgi:hypothetical protein
MSTLRVLEEGTRFESLDLELERGREPQEAQGCGRFSPQVNPIGVTAVRSAALGVGLLLAWQVHANRLHG